jgi:hypothetical protein
MKGLVSFTLFGDGTRLLGTNGNIQGYQGESKDIYYGGAIKNAILYRQWQPSWSLRFYLGGTVPHSLEKELLLANPNCQFVRVEGNEDETATWWRMSAIKDAWDYDFIIFRDVDSRPWARERHAVEEWLGSDWTFHMMRDHNFHGRELMSGMWGIKREAYASLQHLPNQIDENYYGTDQIALLNSVWIVARRKILAHIGSYNIFERMSQRLPFRIPRSIEPLGRFVAQGVYADDTVRYPDHADKVTPDEELLLRDDIFLEEHRVPRKVSV